MIELIIIFATAFLVVPLIDLSVTPERAKAFKIVVLLAAFLIVMFFILFGSPDVLSFRHTWDTIPRAAR